MENFKQKRKRNKIKLDKAGKNKIVFDDDGYEMDVL